MSGNFLLDTNVLSNLERPKVADAILAWMRPRERLTFYVSAVTVAEIESGIAIMKEGEKTKSKLAEKMAAILFRHCSGCLPFDESCVPHYTAVRAMHRANGHTVSVQDMMIAAIALNNRLILATCNTKDFSGLKNLRVVNPLDK